VSPASQSLDFFSLFGLAPRFALDLDALEAAYKQVQGTVHPDRFAAASPAERRVAMQWATQANEGHQVLRSPARRAAYLCERNGMPIDAESNTAMPPAFLLQQMEWREALDDAHGDAAALGGLMRGVLQAAAAAERELAAAIDERRDFAAAAALVRQLMFIDRFRGEVERVQHAHDDRRQAASG
jgi:molecular chaperone HscB